MASPLIAIENRPDGVAVIRLDQPESRVNVLTSAMWSALEDVLVTLSGQMGLRGLVLTSGKPNSFIAGADLKFLANVPAPNDPVVRDLIEQGLKVLDMLESIPVPTCAAVNGPALGGGLEVALACDYRLANADAGVKFGLPEVKLGLIPGWGGTQRLPRIVGLERACGLLLSGEPWTAEEAFQAGLLRQVVSPDTLIETAAILVKSTTPAPIRSWKRLPMSEADRRGFRPAVPSEPDAVREAMLCVIRGAEQPLEQALTIETEAFLRLAGSEDSRQRIASFFAQKPKRSS
ncbi:MAG: enoyl-CoA hydratase/isomerase family protein [Bacteroidales bacterium]|nr:enoyl-CoA hydratase/isomerase family protein [Bacteroidales bacterium]